MSFLYKMSTDKDCAPNYRAFKKDELVELCYELRNTYFMFKKENQQLKTDKTHLIEIISGLINYVKETYNEDLTDKSAEVMEIILKERYKDVV